MKSLVNSLHGELEKASIVKMREIEKNLIKKMDTLSEETIQDDKNEVIPMVIPMGAYSRMLSNVTKNSKRSEA